MNREDVEYSRQVKNSYVKDLFKGHTERSMGKGGRGKRGKGGRGEGEGEGWGRERTGDFGKEGRWKAERGRKN